MGLKFEKGSALQRTEGRASCRAEVYKMALINMLKGVSVSINDNA